MAMCMSRSISPALQARRGHQVVFASAGGSYEPLLRACGVDHLRIVQNQKKPVAFLRAIWEVAQVSRRRQMDLLHAHMMSGALVGYVASRIAGIPLVTTVHNSFDRHSALMRLGDRVVAVSAAERDLLVGRGYKPARVDVVLNGPNGSARDDFASAGYAPELQRPCVTTVCGLHRRKGVFDLISAFAAASRDLPQWRLYVAGEGPDRAALEAFTRDFGHAGPGYLLGIGPVGTAGPRAFRYIRSRILCRSVQPCGCRSSGGRLRHHRHECGGNPRAAGIRARRQAGWAWRSRAAGLRAAPIDDGRGGAVGLSPGRETWRRIFQYREGG